MSVTNTRGFFFIPLSLRQDKMEDYGLDTFRFIESINCKEDRMANRRN
nr:MAG TPA: hypothetical protein [Caudoviricetes sp.]